MAAVSTTIAAISAVATVAGTVMSYQSAQEQASAQKKAEQARQRAAQEEAMQSRINEARKMRRAAAEARQAGVNMGFGAGTSMVTGAAGSAISQGANNIGRINVQEGFASLASKYYQQAADAGASAAGWQSLSNLGSSIFDMTGKSLFAPVGQNIGNLPRNTIQPMSVPLNANMA